MSHPEAGSCGHSDVQHAIIKIAEDIVHAGMLELSPLVRSGAVNPGDAGISVATTTFATGLETGLRAAQMDPIGAQMILDHLDESSEISAADLAEANRIITDDARNLLEVMARQYDAER